MNKPTNLFEEKLLKAQSSLDKIVTSLRNNHRESEYQAYRNAIDDVLIAERNLAKSLGEQYVVTLDFPILWEYGAPTPFVLQNEHKTIIVFHLNNPDPDWDGTYVNVVDPASETDSPLGLVEFNLCQSTKFGTPNDEVHEGHSLFGKGLEAYSAQIVHNSNWIKELQQINSVHNQYDPKQWEKYNHYIFWLHDSTFECVAESYTVETYQMSMRDLLIIANDKLL